MWSNPLRSKVLFYIFRNGKIVNLKTTYVISFPLSVCDYVVIMLRHFVSIMRYHSWNTPPFFGIKIEYPSPFLWHGHLNFGCWSSCYVPSFPSRLVFFLIQFVFFVMGKLNLYQFWYFSYRCIALSDPRRKNLFLQRTNTYISTMIKTNVDQLWYFRPIQRIWIGHCFLKLAKGYAFEYFKKKL
jgi:hypothetical protein